jgi:hypothetical protein
MSLSKKRKKELRKIYEKKKGEEWVKWVKNQPTYSPFEWVEFSDSDKYNCCYLEHFKFGDDFYDWFYKIPKWTPETKWPNSDEEALVINLYENKIKVSE